MSAADRIESAKTRIRDVKIPYEASYNLRGNTGARDNYRSGQVLESNRLDYLVPSTQSMLV